VLAPAKKSASKKVTEKAPAAAKAVSAKSKKMNEANNGDQGQKTSRTQAPAPVQQPEPPADASFFGKAKAAVKKALGKSKSKD
jgi:hypothetical protein